MIAIHRPQIPIQRAALEHAEQLSQLIAVAFEPLDLTRWLVPDDADRVPVMAAFLRISVEHAVLHGSVEVTPDHLGVAVWLPFPTPDVDDYDQRLEQACGRYLDRFQALDTAMHSTHPSDQRHEYLPFIGVHPTMQGRGLGGALLKHHHQAGLDARGVPSYLEAAGPDSIRMYQRHGYTTFQEPFGPVNSDARLHPMWRKPNPTGQ